MLRRTARRWPGWSGASFFGIALSAAVLFWSLSAFGQDILTSQLVQGFGKNKVRYKNFDWWILESEHLDLYYEPEFHELAATAVEYLEEAYVHISGVLHHELSHRPPIVIFKSHYEFQQTNIIHEFLPPGVAGFAEPLRYRIVIPFNGDLDEFRNVLVHELCHIFQYDILYKGPIKRLSNPLSSPPTWIMEGMAEYVTPGRNTVDEMVLRDAVLTDQLIPLDAMNSSWGSGNVFLAYKQSHSIIEYIAANYGPEKISRILRLWDSQNDTDKLLQRLMGKDMDMETLHERWSAHMRKQYWPLLQTRDYFAELGNKVGSEENPYQGYASAKWSLSGDMLAVLSSDAVEQHIDIIRVHDGSLVERVTKGMFATRYDHLTFGEGTVAWAPDGHSIAFVAKKGPKDMILLWDLYDKRLVQSMSFEGLEVIEALSFSPDSRRLAFVGSGYGQSDIYLVEVDSGDLTQITGTPQRDDYPAFSPDGERLAFSSKYGTQFDIKLYDFSSGKSQVVVQSPTDDLWPKWFPDGDKLLFVSTREKINDLFVYDLEEGREYRITRTLSGVMSPDLSADGKQLIISTYYQGRSRLYRLKIPPWPEIVRTSADLYARAEGEYAPGSSPPDSARSAPGSEAPPPIQAAEQSPGEEIHAELKEEISLLEQGTGQGGAVLLADISGSLTGLESGESAEPRGQAPAGPPDSLETAEAEAPELKRRRYVPKLEFDGISLQMGYNTGGFLSSVAQLSMSDLLGNHSLALATDYVASQDISNDFNFAGTYQYYGQRPTYNAAVFNWNQFYSDRNFFNQPTFRRTPFTSGIVRIQQRGALLSASYPRDIYRRLDLNYTYVSEVEERVYPQQEVMDSSSTHLLRAAYVHDSITYGLLGPTAGRSYFLSIGRTLRLSSGDRSFAHIEVDYRHYLRLGRWSVLGLRGSSISSIGPDALSYNLGGPAWWQPFYAGFNLNAGPLRGYKWSELQGSRVLLANAELRVPFIRGIVFGWPGNFVIPAVDGSAFLDVGTAWDETDKLELWPLYNPESPDTALEPSAVKSLRASVGFGLVLYFILPMNFEWVWQTDLQGHYSDRRFHFSFGQSF